MKNMHTEFRAIEKVKRDAGMARTESLEPRRRRPTARAGAAACWGGAVLLMLALGGSVRVQVPADESALAEAFVAIHEVASRAEASEVVETEEARAVQAREACSGIPSPFARALCTASAAIVLDLGADAIADWLREDGEEMNEEYRDVLQRLVAVEAGQVQVQGQVNGLHAEVDEVLTEVIAEVGQRFAEVDERFAEVDERFTATDAKLDLIIQLLRAPRQ